MTTVGVVGAGQLGQMLGHAGRRLGVTVIFLDPGDSPPAADTGRVLQYPFDSEQGLSELAQLADVITYEFENVPVGPISRLAETLPVYPPPIALEKAQDRLAEKALFDSLAIPVAAYRPVDGLADLLEAIDVLSLPLVLKTRRLGYDGKGQFVVRNREDAALAIDALGNRDLIAEQWVNFDREVSAIGARNVRGDTAFYPLTENEHRDGILHVSRAPAAGADLSALANRHLAAILHALNYVGVLALELFVCGDRLLGNEFAPRVHNSGHWTIEGAETSQFENHLRAILDMPLGGTATRGFSGMQNLIGQIPESLAAGESLYLHDYGKTPRPGRKLGHVTAVMPDATSRDAALVRLAAQLNL